MKNNKVELWIGGSNGLFSMGYFTTKNAKQDQTNLSIKWTKLIEQIARKNKSSRDKI